MKLGQQKTREAELLTEQSRLLTKQDEDMKQVGVLLRGIDETTGGLITVGKQLADLAWSKPESKKK
jgi:hypothetical protein